MTSAGDGARGPGPLNAIESVSVVTAVTRRLLDYFTSGEVDQGGRLPSERQLALSLGVGRSAVREALAALELLGVVTVRPGSGTYLRSGAAELLPQTLSWGLQLSRPRTRELVEVRHALEVEAARLAAGRMDAAAVAGLEEALGAMRAHREDLEQFVEADMRFHQLLASGAGNPTLADLLTTVRSLIRVWVERAVSDTAHTSLTLSEHEAVMVAVRAGSPDEAAAAMSRHMTSAAQRLLATHAGPDPAPAGPGSTGS
jgi:GntR family transcriptional repressor for pyruvate dehydrogenase complex